MCSDVKFDKTCSKKNNNTMTNGDIVPTQDVKVHFFFHCATPQGLLTVRASRSHAIRHTTFGRTPLDERSVKGISCFVYRASWFNLINRTNLVHHFSLNMFNAFLYMFRATMRPSSGEITVPMRHLVFVTLYGRRSSMQGGIPLHSAYQTVICTQ